MSYKRRQQRAVKGQTWGGPSTSRQAFATNKGKLPHFAACTAPRYHAAVCFQRPRSPEPPRVTARQHMLWANQNWGETKHAANFIDVTTLIDGAMRKNTDFEMV